MRPRHISSLLALVALPLTSCIQPQPYQQPQMSMAEWQASERAVNNMEDQSFSFRHRERMSEAQATELSTRNNPRSVTNNTTSFWFW